MSEIKTDKLSPRTGAGTVTLGTSGDSYTIPAGVTLTNAGTLTNSGTATGFGKVLQVVSAEYTTTGSTTSTTFVTTGLEASITPSSTSNKILLMASMSLGGSGAVGDNRMNLCFLRNTTEIGVPAASGSRTSVGRTGPQVASGQVTEESILYLDSPSSTSAITYKCAFSARSSYTVWINRPHYDPDDATSIRSASTLVLMEIAG